MTHDEYCWSIQKLVPGALFCLSGTDYENIIWEDGRTKPTHEELVAALPLAIQSRADAETAQAIAKQAVLDRLGITADEARMLLL